ncbi:hypothetical protein JW911_01860 [Candidatus Peregrinibacteria bacterium]|nr:hypothetical protein [Candidatus Peregrinibacteria bacterium]
MAKKSNTIALLHEMLESAEASIRSAKQLLLDMGGDLPDVKEKYKKAASSLKTAVSPEGQIVEGVFDGQNMIGPDKRTYPVPANYASKSKLIPGDVLKLTIQDDGSFIYKQIGPAERKKIVGTLTYEDGQYHVITSGKAYKVLLASITYFRAEVGDKVTLIVPALEDSDWGAIENVLPKIEDEDAEIDLNKF